MDLTSLSSNLPRNPQQSRYPSTPDSEDLPPPAQLMAAFKTAALSVTQLYKSAHAEIEASRKAGYQDCLDDLARLLSSDRIHINSEVAKIREWCNSKRRRTGSGGFAAGTGRRGGNEPGNGEDSDRERASSPMLMQNEGEVVGNTPPVQVEPDIVVQQPVQAPEPVAPIAPAAPAPAPIVNNIPMSSAPSAPNPLSPRKDTLNNIAPLNNNNMNFNFRYGPRMPAHVPPPPPQYGHSIARNDNDDDDDEDMFTAPTNTTANNNNNNGHRSQTGAWKRRFPYDFLEMAALAEKERAAQEFSGSGGGNKRSRMT